MSFAHPELLWLLALLVPLFLWTVRGRWRRRKRWQSLAQRGRPSRDGTPAIVLSIACLIIAITQPRWGNLPSPNLPPGHDLVIVIDTSRSMAAEDAVPNRMAVAIEVAGSLVKTLGQDSANRAAVVAFAGRGVLRCPLTENLGAVLDALDRLRPGSVTPGGTDLGAALDAAIEAVAVDPQEHAQGRAVVIFSDGEDHADRWRSRLERLRDQDIVVHAVSIGDVKEGHPVPSGKTAEPLIFEGKEVLSMRSDAALEAIAQATAGTIVKLGLSSADLGTLYESKIEPLARRQHQATRLAGKAERFPLFLLTAFAFLIIGCLPANRSWHWRMSWLGSCAGVVNCEALDLPRWLSLLSSPRAPQTIRHRPLPPRNRRSWPWPRGGRCMTPVGSNRRLSYSRRQPRSLRARRSRDTTPQPRSTSSSGTRRLVTDIRMPACRLTLFCE